MSANCDCNDCVQGMPCPCENPARTVTFGQTIKGIAKGLLGLPALFVWKRDRKISNPLARLGRALNPLALFAGPRGGVGNWGQDAYNCWYENGVLHCIPKDWKPTTYAFGQPITYAHGQPTLTVTASSERQARAIASKKFAQMKHNPVLTAGQRGGVGNWGQDDYHCYYNKHGELYCVQDMPIVIEDDDEAPAGPVITVRARSASEARQLAARRLIPSGIPCRPSLPCPAPLVCDNGVCVEPSLTSGGRQANPAPGDTWWVPGVPDDSWYAVDPIPWGIGGLDPSWAGAQTRYEQKAFGAQAIQVRVNGKYQNGDWYQCLYTKESDALGLGLWSYYPECGLISQGDGTPAGGQALKKGKLTIGGGGTPSRPRGFSSLRRST